MKFVIVSTRGGKKTRIVKSSTRGEMRRKESEKNRLLEEIAGGGEGAKISKQVTVKKFERPLGS